MDYNNLEGKTDYNNLEGKIVTNKEKKYELTQLIHKSKKTCVYKAKCNDKEFALKVFNKDHQSEQKQDTLLKYFQNDFEICHDILSDMEFVVKMFEIFESLDTYWIVMEYISGKTLREWMMEKEQDKREVYKLIEKISMYLFEIHEKVIHRDISPTNIIISKENTIKFIDFEFSYIIGKPIGGLTEIGGIFCEPYSSPELNTKSENSSDLARRAPMVDIYSVGVIALEMITGKKNSGTKTDKTSSPNYVLSKATAKNPEERYPSIVEFWKELEASDKGVALKDWLESNKEKFYLKKRLNLLNKICKSFIDFNQFLDNKVEISIEDILVKYDNKLHTFYVYIKNEHLQNNEDSSIENYIDTLLIITLNILLDEKQLIIDYNEALDKLQKQYNDIPKILTILPAKDENEHNTLQDFIINLEPTLNQWIEKMPIKYELSKEYPFNIIVNEDEEEQIYYFTLNKNTGDIIKLGEGLYSIVYCAHVSNTLYAIKLLFNRISDKPYKITDDIMKKFNSEFQDIPKDIMEQLRTIEASKDSKTFENNLEKIKLSEEKNQFLIDHINQSIQVDAFERFEFESNAFNRISEKYPKGKKVVGIIETIGGSKKFRESCAFKELKNVFRDQSIEVSDFAILMPYYKYTLKDLLEKGTNYYVLEDDALNKLEDKVKSKDLNKLINNIFTEDELTTSIKNLKNSETDKKTLLKNMYEAVGYDVLRKMDFSQRIKVIIPYIKMVFEGLNILFLTGFNHHDIKTSNIYVIRAGSKEFQVVLGDLAFLRQKKLKALVNINDVHSIFPTGSNHFRSPEQQNFIENCDVEVKHENDKVILSTRDPKFIKSTIMERGDLLIFTKDRSYTPYEIDYVDVTSLSEASILIKGENITKQIPKDKKTQVFLFKRQTFRTDLFSLGAILFDMITCGESAQNFYNEIKGYDSKNYSVEDLLDYYQQVSAYQTYEHDQNSLAYIFKAFRHKINKNYVPPELVKLILKLMLFNTKNSFYRDKDGKPIISENDKDYYSKFIPPVTEEIEKIEKDFRGKDESNELFELFEEKNFDINNIIDNRNRDQKSDDMTEIISDIQQLSSKKFDEVALRLSTGIKYIIKLAELINGILKKQRKKEIFFFQMIPNNLQYILDKEFEPIYIHYKNIDDYKRDIQEDVLYTKLNILQSETYVPDLFSSIRRQIFLTPVDNEKNIFSYRFKEASYQGDYISEGDWIILNSELCKIDKVDNNKITIIPESESNSDKKDENESELNVENESESKSDINDECESELNVEDESESKSNVEEEHKYYIFYRNIIPCKYYFEILSSYLYNIFFVGLNTFMKKPLFIHIIRSYAFKQKDWNFIKLVGDQKMVDIEKEFTPDTANNKKIDEIPKDLFQKRVNIIFRFITQIYLKLNFSDANNSYYRMYNNDDDYDNGSRISTVLKDLRELQTMIQTFLCLDSWNIEDLNIETIQDIIKKHRNTFDIIGEYVKDYPDFDEIVRDLTEKAIDTNGNFQNKVPQNEVLVKESTQNIHSLSKKEFDIIDNTIG